MLRVLTFLQFLILIGNACCSQRRTFNVKIDNNLDYPLFTTLSYGVATTVDFQNPEDTSQDYNIILNAFVRDTTKQHVPFDSCQSILKNNTLRIELKSVNKFSSDKILLVITSTENQAYLVNDLANSKVTGILKELVFRDAIEKRGDEIFGTLSLEIPDNSGSIKYFFKGPFRCKVE